MTRFGARLPLLAAVLLFSAATLSATAQRAGDLRTAADAAVARSLPLLQSSARTWSKARECTSCHHQSLGTLAVEVARERGFAIEQAAADEQVAFTARARDEGASVDTYIRGQGIIGGGSMGLSYSLTGLTAVRRPADRLTDTLAHFIAARQFPDGHFPSPDHRPPHEDSPVATTAFAIRALLAYGRDRDDVGRRVRHAGQWLAAAVPASTEDRAMQLLGLVWAGSPRPVIARLQAALADTQRPDGGWSQMPTRGSDAYATGQVLVVLNQSGYPATSAAYRKGAGFLIRTQANDGSWHVPSRRKDEVAAGNQYFETGFPHGRDQFISYAGSAWATMALTLTRGAGLSPALSDTSPRARGASDEAMGWSEGTTPLMKAALFGSTDTVRTLLAGGVPPDAANAEGTTALMWAATRGVEPVRLLLERGANPNAADADGFTPLMIAAGHSGRIDVMRELIAAGADVNALTRNGWAALRDAVKSGEPAKVHLLLDRGAKLLIAPRNTNRMLMISITQEDTATLAALLDRGLDANHLTNGAFTGLMTAASYGLEGPLELLLRRGARLDAVEQRDGFTALMYAAVTDPGHDRIVRALVRAGARLDVKSTAGLTARDYAIKYGHTHMVAALTPR